MDDIDVDNPQKLGQFLDSMDTKLNRVLENQTVHAAADTVIQSALDNRVRKLEGARLVASGAAAAISAIVSTAIALGAFIFSGTAK